MANKAFADLVRETSTTTGTGSFTVAGAVTGFVAFDDVFSSGDLVYYSIAHRDLDEFETGIGTFTSTSTLARTTVLASSNGGSAVNFSSGTKDVRCSPLSDLADATHRRMLDPAQLTADTNNWTPTGVVQTYAPRDLVVRVDTDATRTVTGLDLGTNIDGDVVTIVNDGSNALVLAHQSGSSDAENRFSLPYSIAFRLLAGDTVRLIYDGTASRWRVISDGRQLHKCRLTRSTTQAITTGTATKVQLNTEDYDIGSIGDPTTYRITVARDGWYAIYGFCSLTALSSGKYIWVLPYVDGAAITPSPFTYPYITSGAQQGFATVRYLTAGQYVELYVEHNHGSDRNVNDAATVQPELIVTELR